jgi:hypothetical protein
VLSFEHDVVPASSQNSAAALLPNANIQAGLGDKEKQIMRHNRLTRLLLANVLIFVLSPITRAQSKNAFVAAWEEIGSTNAKGEPGTGNVGMRRIFTAEGFYSTAYGRQCAGTQPVDMPLPQLTKDQILDRLRCVIAQDGSITVDGDKLDITRRSANVPQNIGTHQVMQWKVENGELSLRILSDTGQAPVGEITRYKRLQGAQTPGPFVGVWEETGSTNPKGESGTGNVGMRRIFTADGFYSITFGRQCAGTQVVDMPLAQLTKDQILDRLRCVIAQDGSITVDGDKLNISRRSDNNPSNVGSHQVMQWKVENDELSLKIVENNNPANVGEITRYRRLK